jgi:hypothetical protein
VVVRFADGSMPPGVGFGDLRNPDPKRAKGHPKVAPNTAGEAGMISSGKQIIPSLRSFCKPSR